MPKIKLPVIAKPEVIFKPMELELDPPDYVLEFSKNALVASGYIYENVSADAKRYERARSIASEPLRGNYLYLGHFWDHNISHFNINSLTTYHTAKKEGYLINPDYKIIINSRMRFQRDLIKLYKLPVKKLVQLRPDIGYRVESLVFSSGYRFRPLNKRIIDLFREALPLPAIKTAPKKIYLSRLDANKRKPENETEVCAYLKEKGFTIVNFGNTPVMAQLLLINSADIIVAAHGASGSNLLYRNLRPFRFIELFGSTHAPTWHTQILLGKNCDYTAIVFQALPAADEHANYIVDLDLLEEGLNQVSYSFRV